MKTINLLLILIGLFFYKSYAQSSIIPAYEIKSDTATWNSITHTYWQILEDKEGTLTFQDVSDSTGGNYFHDSLPQIDQNVKTYWIHYRLKNSMNRAAYISIDGNWDFTDTYIHKVNKGWLIYKSGAYRNWNERGGLKYANMLPDTLKPLEEIIIYQRLHSNKSGLPPNFAIGFLGTQSAIQSYYIETLDNQRTKHYEIISVQELFLVGLLFLAMMLNLFFYKIVKEKEYLYFSLFALFLALNRTYNTLSTYLYWEKPELQGIEKWLTYTWAFIPFFLLQFFRYFLKTDVYYSKWSKLLAGLGILNFILMTFRLIIENTINDKDVLNSVNKIDYEILPFFIIPLVIIITLLLFIKQKDNSVRLIIIGAIPFPSVYFVTHIYTYFLNNGFLKNFRLIEISSLAWLVIFLTITLLMRYDELRKQNAAKQLENERLAKEKEIERNELIEIQKSHLEKEVAERTADLKQSLKDLKATQTQLIQSEKLASLGELTAGIAHEIQNPLNFVNNFSELSVDLVKDLKDEFKKPKKDDAYIDELFDDLSQNQEKINHHGKRASNIVKGMLEHSRASTGVKELTDINKLADEYLRLSYHGLRAKDKDFNADFKTDFDENLPKTEVIPQDIGRVLLNLINNAFYAVQAPQPPKGESYVPTVTVSTHYQTPPLGAAIIIRVKDNGIGMNEATKAKVFQPFFTTKPTGQGTGLGLSLAYDIVTKGHGGALEVQSTEGAGSTFIVRLNI